MALEVQLTEPGALRAFVAEDFVVPPDWAVRLVSCNFGKKGQKYPSSWVHNHSGYPDDYDYPWGLAAHDHSGAYSERWRRMQREDDAKDDKIVVRGNLKEEQYRFWNGSGSVVSDIATCRWCRQWAYGAEAMRAHQNKTDHTRILREVYDLARRVQACMCFVCGSRTRTQRWGIPMCQSNRCRNKWRVAPIVDVSHTLLLYARFARAKGLLKPWINEDGSEKFNTEVAPKQFNWERSNAY